MKRVAFSPQLSWASLGRERNAKEIDQGVSVSVEAQRWVRVLGWGKGLLTVQCSGREIS